MGAAMGSPGHWSGIPYVDAMATHDRATVVPVAAPPSPPPLVFMNRETLHQGKEEKIKVAAQMIVFPKELPSPVHQVKVERFLQ
jgi:hypothetical protein